MPPSATTWQAKVRARIGWPKKGCVMRLVRDVENETGRVLAHRTVYGWLRHDRSPHNEAAILDDLARTLRVPASWLKDGKPGEAPSILPGVSADWIQAVDRANLPARVRPLAYALSDHDAAVWLVDAFERLYLPMRKLAAGPPGK